MQLRTALLPLLASCVLLGACGGDDPTTTGSTAARPTTSAGNTSTETSPALKPGDEQTIRSLAERWAIEVQRQGRDPDPDNPDLESFLADPLLTGYREEWARRQREGLRSRPAVPSKGFYRIDELVVRGDLAYLVECLVNDGVMFKADTGEVVDDTIVTYRLRTTASKKDGEWRLSARTGELTPGVSGCATE